MANFHVIAGASDRVEYPAVRKISVGDLFDCLRLGVEDFWEKPSHYALLGLIYPIVGIVLTIWMSGYYTWPLLYPLLGGFALIGPIAALGLYEISRRREQGLDVSWRHAFNVLGSPAIASIVAVGVMLFAIFTLWLASAQLLYENLFGALPPQTFPELIGQVLTTSQGWTLIIAGNLIGLIFAIITLATSVIAFPLMLDRDCGAYCAVHTSVRVVLANPVPMAAWGLIIVAGLIIGSLPIFVGLAVVIPIFGHATWHLYRKTVEPGTAGARRPARRSRAAA